jgi:hypothetical protein
MVERRATCARVDVYSASGNGLCGKDGSFNYLLTRAGVRDKEGSGRYTMAQKNQVSQSMCMLEREMSLRFAQCSWASVQVSKLERVGLL